jgi:predicted dehydrogenase/threonine dehydrogenase-like Zn-dependent dehydrogenase
LKQVFMRKNPLRRANIIAEDVPVPRCRPGSVVLANRYSLISAGTEGASVRRNMKDMVVKALTDPELRQSVKDMFFKDGIKKTAERVNYETTKWTPMGYSGAGIALEVGRQIEGIREGDLVAYGGQGHAEIVRAAKHLSVPVPQGVSARDASFVALGSIAMQAARRAEVQVGDVCAVIGLGLVGQLVSQMLAASGARVLGADLHPARLDLAKQLGAEEVFRAGPDLPKDLIRYTGGVGVDRAVICASGPSSVVIEQAVDMARDRGRIVVVGMVGLDVPCEAFYMKELDLVISRSYGPGRYDPRYEDQGIDYPVGYVRWTEQRNMQEFLRLIGTKAVDVGPLITHEFGLDEAHLAYDQLLNHPGDCLGIVLRYDEMPELEVRQVAVSPPRKVRRPVQGAVKVAVAGCGGFARQFHLPNVRDSQAMQFEALVASSAQSAKEMASRYGARVGSTDMNQVLSDASLDALMVLTRDNSHAELTLAALKAGKHVFCEKPLATTYGQCKRIDDMLRDGGPLCMVGFNRRFAPLMGPFQTTLSQRKGPATLHYRVNAGPLPIDNWVYDDAYAQGRVVGEVCHFVDLVRWLLQEEPVRVFTQPMGPVTSLARFENLTATFEFSGGSVASIIYTAVGDTSLGKERIEAFADGMAITMEDFRELTVRGKVRIDQSNRQGDKGHDAELKHWVSALKGESALSANHEDGIRATIACLKIFESARLGEPVDVIGPDELEAQIELHECGEQSSVGDSDPSPDQSSMRDAGHDAEQNAGKGTGQTGTGQKSTDQ